MNERSTPAASAGVRGAIDALVQGAIVELFHAYGTALAPVPRTSPREALTFHELAVAIGFTSPRSGIGVNQSGRLTLSMPQAVFALVKGEDAKNARSDDWARELANQLMGRIKNRFLPFGVRLQTGIPTNTDPNLEAQRARSSALRIYTGRTLRGEVLVTLEGLPDESQLAYVGPEKVASEGDTIFF